MWADIMAIRPLPSRPGKFVVTPTKDVPKESGERYYCALIEDATCCLFLLFMCVYMHPLDRRRWVCLLLTLLAPI